MLVEIQKPDMKFEYPDEVCKWHISMALKYHEMPGLHHGSVRRKPFQRYGALESIGSRSGVELARIYKSSRSSTSGSQMWRLFRLESSERAAVRTPYAMWSPRSRCPSHLIKLAPCREGCSRRAFGLRFDPRRRDQGHPAAVHHVIGSQPLETASKCSEMP